MVAYVLQSTMTRKKVTSVLIRLIFAQTKKKRFFHSVRCRIQKLQKYHCNGGANNFKTNLQWHNQKCNQKAVDKNKCVTCSNFHAITVSIYISTKIASNIDSVISIWFVEI